jgi:hypothetical protein
MIVLEWDDAGPQPTVPQGFRVRSKTRLRRNHCAFSNRILQQWTKPELDSMYEMRLGS